MDGIALPLPLADDESLLDLIKRGLKSLFASVLTNSGRAIVTNRIMGVGTEPKFVGWGTGAGTAVVGDTTLTTEVGQDFTGTISRPAGTSSRVTTGPTNDTYQVTATLTCSATGGTIQNAGLFDAASAGNLYVKGDFAGITLAVNDSIAFTFKHQLT
jgi:hypothetical protein